MEWEREFSVDDCERQLVSDMTLVSVLHARILANLELIDGAQVFTADGCRSLSEWVAAKLDVSLDTARSLVRTMRRTIDKPHLREGLASGVVSFDRAEALSRIDGEKDLLEHLDVAGVHRMAADRVELTGDDEGVREQFLVLQPSLDESWWRAWGGFDGITGAVIDRALSEKADAFPDLPDGTRGSGSWRKAMALYQLASGGSSPQAQVTVFVDTTQAVPSDGRAGVRLEAGPRVGAEALSALLCDSVSEVTVNTGDGVPMSYGRKNRNIPPALRRAVLARNGGHCEIFGCDTRYRVEVHHKTPWSQGGRTDPDNLVGLCWFHHHIAVHQRGFEVVHEDNNRVVVRKPGATRQVPTRVGSGRSPEG